jgi:alanine-glyoxylate transaminase / serine-glyoxylate transaminase / serine-pyruvate transaminase
MTAVAHTRLNPVERTILTPELSNPSPRARAALIGTLQGAGDPVFVDVIEQACGLLRDLWRTSNPDTLLVPGTEEAGMEAVLANVVEPGDRVLVGVIGTAGERIAQTVTRLGGEVDRLEPPWGSAITPAVLRTAAAAAPPRVIALAHGDGSSGVLQPLHGFAAVAREHDALLVADVCSTTAVVEVLLDAWELDACWAGSQKGLSAYPGLAMVSFGPRAAERHARRATPVGSWCFDLDGLRRYAGPERHHETFPAPLLYALTEMLQLAREQSMDYRVARHYNRRDALVAGLEAIGLEVLVDEAVRLPSVTVARVPAGVDAEAVRSELREQYRMEIAPGLGAWRNQVWRIGIMSHSAQPGFIIALLGALEAILEQAGHRCPSPGAAVRIAGATLDR